MRQCSIFFSWSCLIVTKFSFNIRRDHLVPVIIAKSGTRENRNVRYTVPGQISSYMKITYKNSEKSFWDDVFPKVEAYFIKNKLSKTGNSRLYIKSAILLISAFSLYWCLWNIPMHGAIALVCCVLLGINF